jgi:4-alpha-glucanotransferase
LEQLAKQGLLGRGDLKPAAGFSARKVNFPATLRFREDKLRQAFVSFRRRGGEREKEFCNFCEQNSDWLEDVALFASLRQHFHGKRWTEWERGVRDRRPAALRAAERLLADETATHRFVQFEFDRQWRELRDHAHRCGIGLIGDLPIFVAHDSADVWCHRDLFQLDRRGEIRRMSGYPPDRFNQHGQIWGHPQYDWATHEQTGFAWWLRRFGRMFELFDAVRIDHFLGFTRTWSIPAGASGAKAGRWVKSPGFKLLAAVERKFGSLPMIAEDVGHVTAADICLRDTFKLAPMRIFQFGFGSEPDSKDHLPCNYAQRCVGYTGNHDNDTVVGWFQHLRPAQRAQVRDYLGGNDAAFFLAAIRAVMASPANVVILPMQDALGLDGRARMNVPGTNTGNWRWRLPSRKLDKPARQLRLLTGSFGRNIRSGK